LQRFLRWFPVAWAAGAYVVLLRLPAYATATNTTTAGGPEVRTTGHATLVEANGPRVYLILAVPVLVSLLAALPWPAGLRRPVVVGAALLSSAFVVLGMASVGLFFLPSAVGLIALAVAGPRPAGNV
jgi:hypothetical protein